MAISSLEAGKKICKLSNWTLTNLMVHKILYIAHMVSLGRDGEPLIDDFFRAWDYGPVLPAFYHKAKTFGSSAVKNVFHDIDLPDEDSHEDKILEEAYENLFDKSASELIAITHWQNGAWARYYSPGRNIKIPNEAILEEYQARQNG